MQYSASINANDKNISTFIDKYNYVVIIIS